MRYAAGTSAILAAAALLGGTGANAQVTPQGGGYLFRQKFTVGQKLNYPIDVSSTVGGTMSGTGAYKMQMAIHMSVLGVKNGVATVRVSSDGMTMNGKTVPEAKNTSKTATVKIDSRGQMIGDSAKGGEGRGGLSPIFPQGPIKIGESFAALGGITNGMGATQTKTTFRLVGFKDYNGQKVAQLALKSDASGQMSGATSGFMLISMADGQIVSGRTDTNMKMGQNGKNMSIVTHMKIERK